MLSRHVSVVIATSPELAYAFAVDPTNLPRWAAGLVTTTLRPDGDAWVADTPDGLLRIRFAPRNDVGVLDHEVTLPSGETTYNPFRIMPHPDGCEAVFTIRQLGLSDAELDRDARLVGSDLTRLGELLTT
jgi:hypothetical protein